MIIKPCRLYPGDTIGIISPASPPPDTDTIDRARAALDHLGFKTKLGPNALRRRGFLAGTDRQRAADLMRMFRDPEVRAILCLRGGYGTSRILDRLDYRLIRSNPKILVGYSDITALHCALLTRAGLVSFHGPMLNSDFAREELSEFTLGGFLRTLMGPFVPGSICRGYKDQTVTILRRGVATGQLVGGNLSLLCTTIGTSYQPSFKRKILFFEDLEEPPYRFDRMLTHLLNAGLLQQVNGIAIGLNRNCVDPKAKESSEYRQTVEDVLRERLLPLKVPVVLGLPFGHVRENATLPIGLRARLDAVEGDLMITESAVRDDESPSLVRRRRCAPTERQVCSLRIAHAYST
jgi:muramoyltetrapeptide carboxypeptidase